MHPKFQAWRQRRMAALRSELGFFDAHLFSPHLAFELSDGCSMQCWYCGFSAPPLRSWLSYAESQSVFRSVVEQSLDILGADPVDSTLLFHATEPRDNPDYVAFMAEFERIAGVKPFTSTAAGHDLDWIASLVRYYDHAPGDRLRINCFSDKAVERIRAALPPTALTDVEINVIDRTDRYPLKSSGRLFPEPQMTSAHSKPDADSATGPFPQTIACLTGFKINLVTRTIELLAPCQASPCWPLGYRVFDRDCFGHADDFAAALERIMERAMPQSMPANRVVGFRDDIRYEAAVDGFRLTTPNQLHTFSAQPGLGRLGALIAEGTRTRADIQDILRAEARTLSTQTALAIHTLFTDGFLDELSHAESQSEWEPVADTSCCCAG